MREYFHCTRLLPDEVRDIKTNGLRPASYDLLIKKLATAGDDLTEPYTTNASAKLSAGKDTVTFFNQKSDLLDAVRVGGYFERWGGAELLNALEPIKRDTLLRIANRRAEAFIVVIEVDALPRINDPHRPEQSYSTDTLKVREMFGHNTHPEFRTITSWHE